MILDINADKNPKDHKGRTPLHVAAKNGDKVICEMILDRIEDIFPKLDDGETTPLHLAVQNGHDEIQKLFNAWINTNTSSSVNSSRPSYSLFQQLSICFCLS